MKTNLTFEKPNRILQRLEVEYEKWNLHPNMPFIKKALESLFLIRGMVVPETHSLSELFGQLKENDQSTLRAFYNDYQPPTKKKIAPFPFDSLDKYLCHLDSVDERSFSFLSIGHLHEIVYGCLSIAEFAIYNKLEPTQHTYSLRLREERKKKTFDFIMVRINSDGWSFPGDRLEILWGPDHHGRYDLYDFKSQGQSIRSSFSEIPSDHESPVIDMRKSFEDFDDIKGFKILGPSVIICLQLRIRLEV